MLDWLPRNASKPLLLPPGFIVFTVIFWLAQVSLDIIIYLSQSRSCTPCSKTASPIRNSSSGLRLQPILSFRPDISELDSTFKCIGTTSTSGKRCGRSIKRERNSAYNTWRYLSTLLPHDPTLTQVLRRYAQFCTCRDHNIQATDLEISEWVKQLRDFYYQQAAIEELSYALLEYRPCSPDCPDQVLLQGELVAKDTTNQSPFALTPPTHGIYQIPGAFPVDQTDFDKALSAFHANYLRTVQALPSGVDLKREDDFSNIESPGPALPSPHWNKPNRPPRMAAYRRTKPIPFRRLVEAQLNAKEAEPGFIYIYTTPGHQGYTKIGYTTRGLDQRIRQWERKCGKEAKLEYPESLDGHEALVPCARRLERLIHADLESKGLRYRETCQFRVNKCSTHDEWFKLDVDEAKKVVKYWESWMLHFRPYDIEYRQNEDGTQRAVGSRLLRDQFLPHLVLENEDLLPHEIGTFYCGYTRTSWTHVVLPPREERKGEDEEDKIKEDEEDEDEEDSDIEVTTTPSRVPRRPQLSHKTADTTTPVPAMASLRDAATRSKPVHEIKSSTAIQTNTTSPVLDTAAVHVFGFEDQVGLAESDGPAVLDPETRPISGDDLASSMQDSFYSLPGDDCNEDLSKFPAAALQLQQAIAVSSVVLTAASSAVQIAETQPEMSGMDPPIIAGEIRKEKLAHGKA